MRIRVGILFSLMAAAVFVQAQSPAQGLEFNAKGQAASAPRLDCPCDLKSGATGSDDYVLGAPDVISVTVFAGGTPNVITATIRPDGIISVPLAGELRASGLTPERLEQSIAQRLKDAKLYVDPNVTVSVVDFKSRTVYISGDGISKPGEYALVVPTKVSELLAKAGGFRDFARSKSIHILRGGKLINYNDADVSNGKRLEQDILLQPGDHIYVK